MISAKAHQILPKVDSISMRYLVVFFVFGVLNSAYTQSVEFREVAAELSMTALNQIEELAATDREQAKNQLETQIKAFYSTILKNKKIKQEQFIDPSALSLANNFQQDANSKRLRMENIVRQPQESYLVAEAPNLYKAHQLLANLYRPQQPGYAVFHEMQSLRYRSLKYSEDVITDEFRLSLLPDDEPEKNLGQTLGDLTNELKEAKQEEQKLQRDLYVQEDNDRTIELRATALVQDQLQTNQNTLEQQLEQQRAALAQQRQQAQANLDRIRQNRVNIENQIEQIKPELAELERRYNTQSATLLVKIAEQHKAMVTQQKEQLRVTDRNAIYRSKFSSGLEFDYSRPRDFETYAQMLEKAASLDTATVTITRKLGEEYARTRQKKKALYWHEETLRRNNAATEPIAGEELKSLQLRTAGLAMQNRDKIKAASYYEQVVGSEAGANDTQLFFSLAKLYADHLGNYTRSLNLLEQWEQSRAQAPQEPLAKIKYFKESLDSLRIKGKINTKLKRRSRALAAQSEAIQVVQNLQLLVSEELQKQDNLAVALNNAKIPLRTSNGQAELEAYYAAETALKNQQELVKDILGLRNTVPLKNIFFEHAYLLESSNAKIEAKEIFELAERLGIAANEARQQIDRLNRQF